MKTNYRIVTNGKVFRVERQLLDSETLEPGVIWEQCSYEALGPPSPKSYSRIPHEFQSIEEARGWIKSQKSEQWEVVR